MKFSRSCLHVSALVLWVAVVLAPREAVAAGRSPVGSAPPARVFIQAGINGLFVTVQPGATLAPSSAVAGPAEQFELHDLGSGLIALKSAVNGKFLSARSAGPVVADADAVGDEQRLRRVGGGRGLERLRAVAAKRFVCASRAGQGFITAQHGCPHDWQVLRFAAVPVPPFTITAPPPMSTLRTTTATFRWEPGGDEYWLSAGTAAGRSDVYASGSLGQATEHTVNNLPLNGAPLHVELRRRQGDVVEAVTAQYTAAIRKGVLVITDFADRRLEDWTGEGMKSVDDVSAELRRMEDHWAWLSRGLEKMRWDIIRVRLAEPALPGAFQGWVAFRDAAITLALQQLETADYDVDSDGVIDASWLIVSNGDREIDYAIGGASRNAGANVFVDGQASGSVVARATGNFNHELGHCLGLPDLYGPYDTVHTLSLMSYSWPVPPPDFTAYERLKLGWLTPRRVTETTSGVWLPPTDNSMVAVMIAAGRPSEYFLIEYRRRPASGYGSSNPEFNGLAIYHVLEGASMWQDPPILKLEPADGSIRPGNEPIDVNDFLSPGNPHQVRPMVLSSYFGDQEIFRIDNLAWRDGGISFDLLITPPAPSRLLVNASFESGDSSGPEGWTRGSYAPMPQGFVWPSAVAAEGSSSAHLAAATGNDMWWSQAVPSLVPGQTYELCGSLKGEEIGGTEGDIGGNVCLLGGWVHSEGLVGTFDWTRRCVTFTPETPRVEVACRLGYYGSTVSGRLWCDGFTLERRRSAF